MHHKAHATQNDDDDTDDSIPQFILKLQKIRVERLAPNPCLFRVIAIAYFVAFVPVMLNTSPFLTM